MAAMEAPMAAILSSAFENHEIHEQPIWGRVMKNFSGIQRLQGIIILKIAMTCWLKLTSIIPWSLCLFF